MSPFLTPQPMRHTARGASPRVRPPCRRPPPVALALAAMLLLLPRVGFASSVAAVGTTSPDGSPGRGMDAALRLLWIPEQTASETLLSALNPTPLDRTTPMRPPADDPRRERIVAAAVRLLEQRTGFRDCSSFVKRVFGLAGETVRPVPLPVGRSLSESMFRASLEVERPRPGDIAVFHNTYDANRDGRRNDRFTHISVVESIEGDVVTLIHRGGRGLARHRMNLAEPDDGATNDPLRRKPKGSRMRVLAGQLFAGYGDLLAVPGAPPQP